ncbi:hypothetical protein VTK73DRAFT_5429 [Phialemonium thermophilum]|uniref:Signal recognition particle subunit SRP14 n=1 Tax=Phialemonium thermophilum TaxID=223376 RepID=A0ABR3WNL8_9PEZI
MLSHDEFFAKLAELFTSDKKKDHGAIYLSQKRLSYGQHNTTVTTGDADRLADSHIDKPLPILIRATNGKGKERRAEKIKLSTVVEPTALEAFYARYAEVCKAGMTALKPRDRTKRKAKARKKKVGISGGAGATSMMAVP